MTWVKIDDQFHSHPKVLAAWERHRAAVGLHMLALSHAAAYLTDGHVSEEFVKSRLPGAAGKRAVAALLEARVRPEGEGLWVPSDGGWVIHDYLEFNESREEVIAKRNELQAQRTAAGRKGARKRWDSESSTNGKQIAPARPGPARPTPDLFPQLAS